MVTPPSSPHPPHPPTAATSHSVFTLKRTRKATCLRSLATRPVGVERPRVPASINSDFKIKNMQLFIPLLNPRSHIIFLPYVAHFLSKSSPTKPKILLFFILFHFNRLKFQITPSNGGTIKKAQGFFESKPMALRGSGNTDSLLHFLFLVVLIRRTTDTVHKNFLLSFHY